MTTRQFINSPELARPYVMQRVHVSDDGCWNWRLYIDKDGYGKWAFGTAHKLSYRAFVGPVPGGLELDHTCKNRSCVNPAHMEPVTHIENVKRGKTATKTHCKNGHPFSGENLIVWKSGRVTMRSCRECGRRNSREYTKRKRKN